MIPHTFHIQTFGCQMNANDSDWLVRVLSSKGFVETPFEQASIFILNTCTVRDKPEQKVYSELGRIAHFCKRHKRENVFVCVGGCVAQQIGAKLAKRFPQVRLVFGTDGVAQVPDAISDLVTSSHKRIILTDFTDIYAERMNTWDANTTTPTAFVNIMQGCNNFCTYCIVPYVRGTPKSRDPKAILEECRLLCHNGTQEITLLGQNVNAYGLDFAQQNVSFVQLLQNISELEGLKRLRFVTTHPKDIPTELIELFGTNTKLCPRLHLPLQSGSDVILKKMNRKYTQKQYLLTIEALKKTREDMVFSTDVIIGFPGETDADFAETMRIMHEVGYISSFSFIYSDRPKTKALLMPHKIERKIALERLAVLQEWQTKQTDTMLTALHGEQVEVLLDTKLSSRVPLYKDGRKAPCVGDTQNALVANDEALEELWQGKTVHDVKVNVALPASQQSRIGQILMVQICATGRQTLVGKPIV